MKRLFLASISLLVLTAAQGAPPAEAQTRYYQSQANVVLVAPDGAILDYTPDQGDVIISRDGMGRRVYLDRRGNIVATEVRQETSRRARSEEYPPAPRGYRNSGGSAGYEPGYGNSLDGGFDEDGSEEAAGGYRDYRQYRPGEPGAVTGGIPGEGSVSRLPLDDQALPGVDAGYPQEASIEPDQAPVQDLQPQKPIITVTKKPQAEIAALQVFLDREGISPGVIDGHLGDNVNKAIAAWQEMTGETLDPNNSEDIMQRLTYSGGLPIVDYTISAADAAGPYVASIPEDYAHKAQLPAMSYTTVTEKLAEQFHMDEGYLKALNPNADFSIPGTTIKVINPGQPKVGQVTRIVADKYKKQVFAYGADGRLVSAYPATIGSSDTPSPSGNHTVDRIALDPGYTYNPKINFTQGNNTQILQIPPGPNGPVGTVWIALSKPTYGIHGTPEPSKIGKTNSHGCVRLTNWDATELAKMVKPGTTVEFLD
ncbi:L,D-transpeptidase [Rhizobium deserti]|uniref:L,D-transpeptidase n=1 Tax=Rhizobium deserti TaxID=2547961 RepID=A0A4V6PLZ5_9HYPH|nr:L,D-transpeptidase [Rhizobium deserti]TDK38900.1 L,D-transpeptidase [Rhizobium deserti]